MDPSREFKQLLAEDWEMRMVADPLFATSTGDNRFNDRLPAISEAYFETYLSALNGLKVRLGRLARYSLPAEDKLN
jgi:hypothetical protein